MPFIIHVQCSDQHGFSPLHYASMYGHAKVVDMFLHRGARTDTVNMGGNSLLHMAAQYGKYDVLIKVSPPPFLVKIKSTYTTT